MAFTSNGKVHDGVQGGWIEFGTFTLDPASIAATAQGAETVTISGIAAGDQAVANPRGADAMLAFAGCEVTDTDELTVYLNNAYDATTAVDGASLTYDVIIFHRS